METSGQLAALQGFRVAAQIPTRSCYATRILRVAIGSSTVRAGCALPSMKAFGAVGHLATKTYRWARANEWPTNLGPVGLRAEEEEVTLVRVVVAIVPRGHDDREIVLDI